MINLSKSLNFGKKLEKGEGFVQKRKTEKPANFSLFLSFLPFSHQEGLSKVSVSESKAGETGEGEADDVPILFSLLEVHPFLGQLKMVHEGFCTLMAGEISCDPDFAFEKLPKNTVYVVRAAWGEEPLLQTVVFGYALKPDLKVPLSPATTAATEGWLLYLKRAGKKELKKEAPPAKVGFKSEVYAKMVKKYHEVMGELQKKLPEGTKLTAEEMDQLHKKVTKVLLNRDVAKEEAKAKDFLKDFGAKHGAK